ncbi:hypothetical protein GCM10010394_56820 [Streptomyces crystallinus]|uniref:Uncharacterized protein n=1 Tax=Streptomyces crystallinus TaxID=68191 RepID=A0ABP3S0D5_9ACTN
MTLSANGAISASVRRISTASVDVLVGAFIPLSRLELLAAVTDVRESRPSRIGACQVPRPREDKSQESRVSEPAFP